MDRGDEVDEKVKKTRDIAMGDSCLFPDSNRHSMLLFFKPWPKSIPNLCGYYYHHEVT